MSKLMSAWDRLLTAWVIRPEWVDRLALRVLIAAAFVGLIVGDIAQISSSTYVPPIDDILAIFPAMRPVFDPFVIAGGYLIFLLGIMYARKDMGGVLGTLVLFGSTFVQFIGAMAIAATFAGGSGAGLDVALYTMVAGAIYHILAGPVMIILWFRMRARIRAARTEWAAKWSQEA
jgi:hypothetical protein